ncbi:MAG: hypothetical protein H6573_15715 [Lewinellaceae bacterium]|nr:hypothetical protein [Phaeodactylibacter sp.]MCB9348935.1 hypothetical protein [Lewinellaceae bacterium]
MKIPIELLALIILFFTAGLKAQPSVEWIESVPNGKVTVNGNLSEGDALPDLSWAWSSQNACFVSTQQHKFSGRHVLYQTQLPARAEMTVRVIPDDPKANFSLYAYSSNGEHIVPNLPRCVSCEADYKWDYKYRGKTQDHTRSVSLRAVGNPYVVTIGVAGADGLGSGSYTLEILLEGGETAPPSEQAEVPKFSIDSRKGETLTYQGRLEDGVPIHDLSWAWSSQNACFVSIRQSKFTGNHLLYLTNLPPHSEIEIGLRPEDGAANMSLYAYSLGAGNLRFVPGLPSCISCEASFQPDLGQPTGPERKVSLRSGINPLQVVIGIAGAEGLSSGAYLLTVSLK